jgi:hypothetical protein
MLIGVILIMEYWIFINVTIFKNIECFKNLGKKDIGCCIA